MYLITCLSTCRDAKQPTASKTLHTQPAHTTTNQCTIDNRAQKSGKTNEQRDGLATNISSQYCDSGIYSYVMCVTFTQTIPS
jgi:hypothetical protein